MEKITDQILNQSENRIMSEFAQRLNITPTQIIQQNKCSEISEIRYLYCKLRCERHGASYSATGREISRAHATVMYGIKRINSLLLLNDNKIITMWSRVSNISELYPARNDATLIEN